MRTFRLGAATLALATALPVMLSGCRPGQNLAEPARYGDPAAIVSEVSVTPLEFRAGENAQIEVVVRNPTSLPIRVHFTSGCMVMFAVRAADDAVVAPVAIACTANAPTLDLAPGERVVQRFLWNGAESGPNSPKLPPGDYRVVGGFDPGVQRNASAPVAIRILAP